MTIATFHEWYNQPLNTTEWVWLLSASRMAVLGLLLIFLVIVVRNGVQLRMLGRYLPIIVVTLGLAFYYFDQLFWDTRLQVKVTPAIIVFNVLWAGMLLAGSIISRDAKRVMDEYSEQKRRENVTYVKRQRSVMARREDRIKPKEEE